MNTTPVLPGETPLEWANRVLKKYGRCIYCGRSKRRHGPACHAHADLLEVDPFFSPDEPQQEPAERSLEEALLDRLPTTGG